MITKDRYKYIIIICSQNVTHIYLHVIIFQGFSRVIQSKEVLKTRAAPTFNSDSKSTAIITYFLHLLQSMKQSKSS